MKRLIPPVVVLASVTIVAACADAKPHAVAIHATSTTSTASTTTTTFAPTTTTTDPTTFAAWSRVAVCENGGWNPPQGAAYPNSLGISAVNYYANGGDGNMSPAAQIAVAQRIEANAGLAGYVPDQSGCAAW